MTRSNRGNPPDDDELFDDTVVDRKAPAREDEAFGDTARSPAAPSEEGLDGPTRPHVRSPMAEAPTLVSRPTPPAPGLSSVEVARADREAAAYEASDGAPTRVEVSASSGVGPPRGRVDDDDVFTDGTGTTQPLPLPTSAGVDNPTTEQFRLQDVVLPPRVRDVAEPVEQQLGGYHVHHYLGSGGMATVYLAHAPGLDANVVVKRVRPERLKDRRNIGRFRQEAQIALTLSHPNIVRTLDHAEDDGEQFLVMEYLDGYDLRTLSKRLWELHRPVPMEPALLALAQAARGLDYAHRRPQSDGRVGIIHRDVSPENIFVTEDGFAKLLDFGLALGFDSKRFSATGEVMGKIGYLSPEAIRGEEIDGRSDLFALCVTAWWVLTGRRPFSRKSPLETLQAILNEDPPPLTELNPTVPPALSAVLRKGLEKDPRWRYARAADLADAFEDVAGAAALPPDATRLVVLAADAADPPPDRVRAPFPTAVPWSEWKRSGPPKSPTD